MIEMGKSEFIISRSGYSSIMDLVSMHQKSVLIPTPGQIEQEYLAQHLKNNPLFVFSKQTELDLEKLFGELEKKPEVHLSDLPNQKELIRTFLRSC